MHILLQSEDQLAFQRAEAIKAFQQGDLKRSLKLFEAILEHWPLDPIASSHCDTIKELLDWGIDPGFLEYAAVKEHSAELSLALPLQLPPATPIPPSISMGPLESGSSPALTPPPRPFAAIEQIEYLPTQRDSAPPPSIKWPKELHIVRALYHRGRRKAARMWAQSYLENQIDTDQKHEFLQGLPDDLRTFLQSHPQTHTKTLSPPALREIHPYDSHSDVPSASALSEGLEKITHPVRAESFSRTDGPADNRIDTLKTPASHQVEPPENDLSSLLRRHQAGECSSHDSYPPASALKESTTPQAQASIASSQSIEKKGESTFLEDAAREISTTKSTTIRRQRALKQKRRSAWKLGFAIVSVLLGLQTAFLIWMWTR